MMVAPLLLLAVIAACSGAESDQIAGEWILDSIAVDGVFLTLDPALPVENDRGVVAWFAFGVDGHFAGEGPCNDVTGQYRFDGVSLSVSDESRSAVVCVSPPLPEEDLMDTEDLLFDALLDAPDVYFSSDIRMQWQTEHTTLTFRRAP